MGGGGDVREALSRYPTVPRESERPSWLVIPEKGLYTGVLVVGAVGTGKTTACMYPFAQQLLSWQADDPRRRAGALVLEVKGDFCHQVRGILEDAGRGDDYLEIGLGGSLQWNPLDDPLLDSYSLAYGVASLINQLFGKSREPFWQQAYTNLVRWIIELHRLLPGGWVTLRDVYRCTVDPDLLANRIREAQKLADELCPVRAVISDNDLARHPEGLSNWTWTRMPGTGKVAHKLDPKLRARLKKLKIKYATETPGGAGEEFAEQVEAVARWYVKDWSALDAKLRTSIVEGISVFLSLFDQPEVAGVFCPPPPTDDPPPSRTADEEEVPDVKPMPGLRRRLPPLSELIEGGKVLALNMPAGANPALARAIGVLLKNAWMQALLRRPAEAARRPAATCGPPCSSAMSIRPLRPWARTTRPATRRRSRSRASAAASPSSPRSRSRRSAPCCPPERRGARSSRRSAPGSSCRSPTRRRPGSRPRCAARS